VSFIYYFCKPERLSGHASSYLLPNQNDRLCFPGFEGFFLFLFIPFWKIRELQKGKKKETWSL
jgi:hypothetical protein